jgi:hypothetical protein
MVLLGNPDSKVSSRNDS